MVGYSKDCVCVWCALLWWWAVITCTHASKTGVEYDEVADIGPSTARAREKNGIVFASSSVFFDRRCFPEFRGCQTLPSQ